MRILVTGSNGLLGTKLVELLTRQPHVFTIAAGRKQLTHLPMNSVFCELDLTDDDQIEKIISLMKPEVVIHTAAMTQVDQCETARELCWKTNATAVDTLVKACNRNHAHLVHVSTDFIFDGSYGPLEESAVPGPVNFYGESKLAAEKIIQQHAYSWAIIRTVLVYGVTSDMSRSNIVLWVKNSLENGKQIQVVNDQWRTPTLAEDLAMGCWLAAQKKASGIFHISGEEMMTPYDIAIHTAKFFKLDQSLIKATDSTQFRQPARRPPKTGFIITKAKKELGYQPHKFQEGLAIVADQLPKR